MVTELCPGDSIQKCREHVISANLTEMYVSLQAVIFAIQQFGGLTRDEAEELSRNYVLHSHV